jgi:hypothetical protein
MVLANPKTIQNFKCNCLEPCSKKTVELMVQRNPATVDLLNQAPQNVQDGYKRKRGCVQPYDKQRLYPHAAVLRVVLFKAEDIREQAVVYSPLIALADVYNALGLFFGLCILNIYETLEKTFLEHLRDKKKSVSDAAGKVEHNGRHIGQVPGVWHNLAKKVQRFRYITGYEVSYNVGYIPEMVHLPWMLLWILLASLTIQQV